jgi:hypothetical protein
MDLVFFAGPVIVGSAFQQIDWFGRQVQIVPIPGAGSAYFSDLAEQLRDPNGRILPRLMATYAPHARGVDHVALAAYSAGHGLLNKITDVEADRKAVSAVLLHDATFSGAGDPPKRGYVKFGVDAARGSKLMVSTTTHITPGGYLSGRDSWVPIWNAVQQETGRAAKLVSPEPPTPPASGGWWSIGARLYWGDYVQPGSAVNTGNDLTHVQHHDLAPAIWQAYLAPWFRGPSLGIYIAGGALAALAVSLVLPRAVFG